MSTTFDPSKEAPLHLLAQPASANGKAEHSLSHSAARPDFWRKSAPKELRSDKLEADEALNVYFSKREPRSSIAELCRAADTPLRWGLIAGAVGPTTTKLIDVAGQVSSRKGRRAAGKGKEKQDVQAALVKWLEAERSAPASYDLGVGCLAAAHILDALGGALSHSVVWKLIDFLAHTAAHAPSWNLGADAAPEDVVAAELLGAELPLTLAYLFSEMTPLEKGARPAIDYLSDSIPELLNGHGLPRAAHLSVLRPLLACWTRCRAISQQMKRGSLTKKAQLQYEWLVRQSLRWTRPDGTPLLSGDGADAWCKEFLRAALRLGGAKKDAAAARELLGAKAVGKLQTAMKAPSAAYNCEWAGLAVMRRGWSPDESVVAVDYSTAQMRLEMRTGKRLLFGGPVTAESHVDGKPLRPIGSWDELCWFEDKDVNYLELSLPLQDGAYLGRQILLALREGFVLIVDHLQAAQSATLEHAWQAPLAPGLLFCGEGETRDALLVDGEPVARVIPLALPEWRVDPRMGELSYTGGGVKLTERAPGRTLACPLFIDLQAERAGRESTWRQLTVAESLAIQTNDVAVSYRIQSGDDQWVYYRSQGPRGNRTFMGQNTSSECMIAKFTAPSGKIKSLVEIEG